MYLYLCTCAPMTHALWAQGSRRIWGGEDTLNQGWSLMKILD